MPLYMDVHDSIPEGASAKDVADAHRADLEAQDRFGVNYRSYWLDQSAGKIFCLVEAPTPEAAHACHREAHGLVADEIYEVVEG